MNLWTWTVGRDGLWEWGWGAMEEGKREKIGTTVIEQTRIKLKNT